MSLLQRLSFAATIVLVVSVAAVAIRSHQIDEDRVERARTAANATFELYQQAVIELDSLIGMTVGIPGFHAPPLLAVPVVPPFPSSTTPATVVPPTAPNAPAPSAPSVRQEPPPATAPPRPPRPSPPTTAPPRPPPPTTTTTTTTTPPPPPPCRLPVPLLGCVAH